VNSHYFSQYGCLFAFLVYLGIRWWCWGVFQGFIVARPVTLWKLLQ
jgi:hypothetical protein